MPFERVMRWIARWLESRGLNDVANTIDTRIAHSGDIEAMHAIARRALERGKLAEAISQLETALQFKPDDPSLWCTLGAAYRQNDDFELARTSYERAVALKPKYPQALSNLGELCIAQSRAQEALEWFDRALICTPEFFEARLNKVAALFELARYNDARKAAEQLIVDEPDRAEAYLNLGNILIHTGKAKQGIKQYKKALELRPRYAEAHFNLATLLGSRDDLINAIGYLERQIKERGETVHHMGLLAAAHQASGHLAKAKDLARRVLDRQPDNINALVTLASCLSASGNAAEALKLYEQVVRLDNTQTGMASNVLFESNNLSGLERHEVFRKHREWATRFETPLLKSVDFSAHDRNPSRKLRIGYISGDFIRHPVGFLLRDVLRYHDKDKFEVHCFSMVSRSEDLLPDLRDAVDKWEDIFFLSDEEVVDLIRKAEIDILVDLSGHTAHNRLLVFARRPAPVQVEWIGYFHSTGLTSIDYFITDPYTTPIGSGQLFSETPVFMPHTRFCYGPPEYTPDVVPPPLLKSGRVTFGSFNRLSKITDEVAEAWAQILRAVPDSRLLLKAGALADTMVTELVSERFAKLGIDPDRIELREGSSHSEMFMQYGDVDIALDTFPFNGGMTTLEALWMGVPVITIAGNSVVARQTISALANIGLAEELAFQDIKAYIAGAIALARNPSRITELRDRIRPLMAGSPLRQADQFVDDLEALYRRMWQAWCKGEKLADESLLMFA
ncbi:MAG TPA: tetratricopeptide repeat protein [Noviherbaspirillum sp.]|uniref:O-linked N-acetylglucosamine transferase family protein n=1 Tax=Noviherbaspirillum sp. TaxID=1926288 RepID=UPI002B473E50|nr:tetratricopeptide repeat protein [Noviherbaspirillum sp.]HJV85652.1 tetratricopeptide repeat protein [Noviherbaspirillum sp.]